MRNISLLSSAAALLLLTGCAADNLPAGQADGPVPVRLTVSQSNGLSLVDCMTRAVDGLYTAPTGFDGGEAIQVYLNGGEQNAEFTVDSETPTKLNGTLYYPTSGDITLYAVYPAAAATSLSHTVSYDQTAAANYKASDLMYANKAGISQAEKTSEQNLEFRHQLVKLKVVVKKDAALDEVTRVEMRNVKRKAAVNFSNSKMTVGDEDNIETASDGLGDNILVFSGSNESTEAQTYAVMFPAQAWDDADFITVTADGENVTYKLTKSDWTPGSEYTLTLNVNAASLGATVSITSWENGGEATIEVSDDEETVGDFTFSTIEPQTYTGSPLTPAITVSYNGTELTSGTDYDLHYFDNTNAGRVFVVAVGKGTYADKVGATTFTILRKSLDASMLSAIADQTYTGSAIEAAIPLTYGGNTLTVGTDYTVTYADNVNVGTATVTITATGNYSGELEKTFNIIKATPVITMSTDAVTLKPDETTTRTATTTFGTVSYESSNTSVATVDATTGKVTAVADGTATITASVAESDNWNAASKQYTVTVKTSSTNEGAIGGAFTINASGTKVNFARGNLRATYDGSSWTWDFHENQWDYIGDAPGNTKVTDSEPFISANGTVDLFGWVGASSTWTGVAQYGITSSTATNNTNGYGNVATESLKSDWGKLIGDGNTWRTLTSAEWKYLFNTRTVNGGTGNGKSYTLGQSVNGKLGVVIYPDGYTGSTYTTGSDWSSFESAGCVFLPAAGGRGGASVSDAGSYGDYWSSSPLTSDADLAYYVYFGSGYLSPARNSYRYRGLSVRLVCPAQ